MPVNVFLADEGATSLPAAPLAPAPAPAPLAPASSPAIAPPPPSGTAAVSPSAAAAGAAVLLAGGGSAEIAAAETAAGASVSVQQAILAAGIPAPAGPQLSPAPLPPSPDTTQAQIDAANAAAAYTAAGAAALLAGGSAADIAAAEAAAGAPESVVQAILDTGIPGTATVDAGGPGMPGDGVGGTDDIGAAAAVADANRPDLSDLPAFELLDPFGLQSFAVTNPPLKGMAALTAIAQACSDFGIDTLAVVANALHEGASGAIGDGGLAYGPWQDHLTEFAGRPFYGKGRNNQAVNAWAWTENGIRYSVRQMATGSPSAKGLRGHPAVYAIVYGYERPADKAGAYRDRAAEYDRLAARGAGWAAYAAPLFKGPAAGGAVAAVPGETTAASSYKPAGVVAQWRELVDVFKLQVPKQHNEVKSLGKSLKEVFR